MTFKKPPIEELKKKLSPLQCQVTQDGATEKPFQNEFWDNKKPGLYVDVVSGEVLFSSLDKYDSGSGWPSFTKPLVVSNITKKKDTSHGMERTEIRSAHADSHLGHVFDDGPGPTHLRYCINSASMRFIPLEALEKEGYSEYRSLFMSVEKTKELFPPGDYASNIPTGKEVANVAGGCFWGVEEIIRGIKGVEKVQVGYTGGSSSNPTYKDVCTGKTGHAEAVQILFDPKVLTYSDLLHWFFRLHDPTTMNRQGNDIGTQYRSAIFVYNEKQKKIAQEVINEVEKKGKWKKPIITQIDHAKEFWVAEEYHQDYLQKNPTGYTCHYLRD